MRLRIPKRLRKRDCIGLVAPASPASSPDKIERGIRYLERLGYHVKVGKSVLAQTAPDLISPRNKTRGYLSASDAIRAADLQEMFSDQHVNAIFCTRGGYGTPRLLPLLDYDLIKRTPKIFVGYSDITALHNAFFTRCGMISFAGPMVAVEMQDKMDAFTEESFWEMLTVPAKRHFFKTPPHKSFKRFSPGGTEGTLLGGNLALLTSILGTPFVPAFRRTILFLEDIREKVFRIDRMFAELRNAGVLNHSNGFLLGQFTSISADEPSLTLDEVVQEYLTPLGKPVISEFPFGHTPPKVTLPIGAHVKIDAKKLRVTIMGNVVE